MKKDGRFWILIGALVIVGGLFFAFIWSVMAAPSEPAGNQVVANVSEPAPTANVTGEFESAGGKPAESGQAASAPPPGPVTVPPPVVQPDVDRQIREAREAADRAQAEARRALQRAQADIRRATERTRQQRRRAATGSKPTDDKPPEDW